MRADDFGKLTLRLAVGGLMLFHGIAKIQNGVGFIENMLVEEGLPSWIAYGVYVAEVIAPILIILGVATRFAAATIMIDMIGAIVLAYADRLLTVNAVGGWAVELEMFYLLSALSIVIMGAGAFSLAGSKIRKPMIIRTPQRVKERHYPTPPPSPTPTY